MLLTKLKYNYINKIKGDEMEKIRIKEKIDEKYIKRIENNQNKGYTDESNNVLTINLENDKLFDYIDVGVEVNYVEHSPDFEKTEVAIYKTFFYKDEIDNDEIPSEIVTEKFFYHMDYYNSNYEFDNDKFYEDIAKFVNNEIDKIIKEISKVKFEKTNINNFIENVSPETPEIKEGVKKYNYKSILICISGDLYQKIMNFENQYHTSKNFLDFCKNIFKENFLINDIKLLDKLIRKCIYYKTDLESYLCSLLSIGCENKKIQDYYTHYFKKDKMVKIYFSQDEKEKIISSIPKGMKAKEYFTIKAIFFIEINEFIIKYQSILAEKGLNNVFTLEKILYPLIKEDLKEKK